MTASSNEQAKKFRVRETVGFMCELRFLQAQNFFGNAVELRIRNEKMMLVPFPECSGKFFEGAQPEFAMRNPLAPEKAFPYNTTRMALKVQSPKSKVQSRFDLEKFLVASTASVNAALDAFLPSEKTKPATMHKAMRYSLFAGGKRMRPALCLAAAAACGGRETEALPLACAVECIHTYSLVHDDLPAMDNDDYRRGKLTNHKVFGEGIAVLAGDALLTQAFEIAAQARGWPRYSHRQIILEIAQASGSLQLIAGQVADLEGEGKKTSVDQLRYIHERKTSALLCCSVRLGGMSANCSPAQLKALTDFGYHVGLAFQVIDDILDVTQTSEQLGKTAGKDTKAQKATYPSIVGLEKSRKIAADLTGRAFAALKIFKGEAEALEGLAEFLLKRDR
jgi:geranylgeranyl diphosphate synthase type II